VFSDRDPSRRCDPRRL